MVAGWKKEPSWEAAMKRVNVALRARIRSWKGRRGGWGVRARRGLRTLERRGGEYGRVMVWYSSMKREETDK